MKRVLSSLLVTLATALSPLPVLAQAQQERWYEVEIILFEQLNPMAQESESWPQDPGHPNLEGAIELHHAPETVMPWLKETPSSNEGNSSLASDEQGQQEYGTIVVRERPVPYEILPKEQLQMQDAYRRLEGSTDYLPLVHVAWRQPIPPREHPDHILITDRLDKPIIERYSPLLPTETQDEPLDLGSNEQATPDEDVRLKGIISLAIARYLHVEADLLFHKPEVEASGSETTSPWQIPKKPEVEPQQPYQLSPRLGFEKPKPEYFRITGTLRMRSKEIHYLDHPMVGMLILFTPIEIVPKEYNPADDKESAE